MRPPSAKAIAVPTCVLTFIILFIHTFNFTYEQNMMVEYTSEILGDTDDDEPQTGTQQSWLQERKALIESQSPHKLLFFSYMRGGSSIGGELFNMDPEAVLWYEPLDPFYSGYYGFPKETIPLNILYTYNASRRSLDQTEKKYLAEFFKNAFSCNYQDLPLEVMSHYFLTESTAMDNYWKCFSKGARQFDICKSITSRYCGSNVHIAIHNRCHDFIDVAESALRILTGKVSQHSGNAGQLNFNNRKHITEEVLTKFMEKILSGDKTTDPSQKRKIQAFSQHALCMRDLGLNYIKPCLSTLINQCKTKQVHAMEVIRLKLEDVENLILQIPDLHVVFYVRDPRAIVNSRMHTHSLMWDKRKRTHTSEASIFCSRITEDIKQLNYLESKYPDVFMHSKYEDFVNDPEGEAKRIYDQFNRTVPKKWAAFAQQTMHSTSGGAGGGFGIQVKNASAIIHKWRTQIPSRELKQIDQICAEAITKLGYEMLS